MDSIVVCELLWGEGLEILRREAPHLRLRYDPGLHRSPESLGHAVADACALIVRNQTQVDRRLLDAAPRLQVIGRLGAGLDNVDLTTCADRRIPVVYAPFANAISVAEMTVGLVLALLKKIPEADRHVRRGGWDRSALAGRELWGKTVGILGFGRVGRLVAARMRAFGAYLQSFHPRLDGLDPAARDLGIRMVDMESLLREADVLTVHLPLKPETRGLLGEREFALMKPSAVIVNTSRGGVIDERALAEALRAGTLAGAALDVREVEPPAQPDPFAGLPNAIITPHVAGLTEEAQAATAVMVVRDVLGVLAGRAPRHPAL